MTGLTASEGRQWHGRHTMYQWSRDDSTRATREELERWIEVAQSARLDQFAMEKIGDPIPGSFLRPRSDIDPLRKMTAWCRGYLEAAIDHLILWADHAVPLIFHPDVVVSHSLRPALTLARAAMESASQTIWILGPEDKSECGRRYIQLAVADLIEQVKAAETPEKRSHLQARRDDLLAALGLTPRAFVTPTYLEMVRYSAEFLSSGITDRLEAAAFPTPDRVERLWRSSAGAAHGKRWPEWELPTVVEEQGEEYAIPDVAAMAEILKLAESFVAAGVVLFAHRSGHEAVFPSIWQEGAAFITANMTLREESEPIDPAPLADS